MFVDRGYAKVAQTGNGYAIEFLNNVGCHSGWFTKRDGSIKEWREEAQARRVFDKHAEANGWREWNKA